MRGGGKEGDIGKTHAYDPAVLDVNLHLLLIVRDGGDGGVDGEHVSFWEGWRGRKMGELVGGMEGIWRGRRGERPTETEGGLLDEGGGSHDGQQASEGQICTVRWQGVAG